MESGTIAGMMPQGVSSGTLANCFTSTPAIEFVFYPLSTLLLGKYHA